MYRNDSRRSRVGAAAAALGLQFAVLALLAYGLATQASAPEPPGSAVATFDIEPLPEPQAAPTEDARAPAPAAPAAPAAEALPVEAPEPPVALASRPAGPSAASGAETSQGAADAGSGQGSGGQGGGTGAGGSGSGAGGIATPARRIAGALSDNDYPRDLEAQRIGGIVRISFRVRTDGRVDRCSVVGSSGNSRLDALTCRLFTERYRFSPAMTAGGQPVETTLQTSFTWSTRRR